MPPSCNKHVTHRGICERLRMDKKRHGPGIKRRTYCNVYTMYSDSFCMCYGRMLRSKRKSKMKSEKYAQIRTVLLN